MEEPVMSANEKNEQAKPAVPTRDDEKESTNEEKEGCCTSGRWTVDEHFEFIKGKSQYSIQ